MQPLSTYELRVLKAIEDRPGGTTMAVIGQMTGYGERDLKLSLSILELDELVDSHVVERTGTTWWRTTRAGRERLRATPPPLFRRRRAEPGQLELVAEDLR